MIQLRLIEIITSVTKRILRGGNSHKNQSGGMTKVKNFKIGEQIEGTYLTPIRFSRMKGYPAVSHFIFRCERCGNEKEIRKGNVRADNVKSCGCLQKDFQKEWAKKYQGKKGKIPWNKGLKGMRSYAKGHPNIGWKRGKIKITGADGSIEWVKVSDEKIGPHSEWYKRKRQLGIR